MSSSGYLSQLLFEPAIYPDGAESRLAARFLPERGIFVEVGAYHPTELSQSWHLEQRGWTGLLIEPVPEHAAKIKNSGRRAQLIEAACGAPERHGSLTRLHLSGPHTSSIHRERSETTIDVPTVSLDKAIADAGLRSIDFLSVDVEGGELDVMRGFPFDRFRPSLISIEDYGCGLEKHRFMTSNGYRRIRRVGDNSWYVPRQTAATLSVLGSLQLLRKFYLSLPIRLLKKRIKTLSQSLR